MIAMQKLAVNTAVIILLFGMLGYTVIGAVVGGIVEHNM